MTVKTTKSGEKTLIAVEGRIDTGTAEEFQREIAPVISGDDKVVEMDCSGLNYTSSQGLRIILSLQMALTSRGGSLTITGMQAPVREVFDITGFSSIIKIL